MVSGQESSPVAGPAAPSAPPVAPFGMSGPVSRGGTRPTNSKAIVSLVCGCVGIFACCAMGLPSIVAIVFGHMALGELRSSGEHQSGKEMAIAGLITGYVGVVLILFLMVRSG